MMTFQIRLKKTRKPNQPRLRFDLEKLRDPDVACTFQATIGGKFAPLIGLSDEDMDMDTMITTYNTAVTDAASEILGKECRRKKPWVTKDVLDLCDERRDLKKKRYEAEGAKEYREANRRIQKAVKKAKEDWIGAQCKEIETCLNKTNNKRAYLLVKDLTSEKQDRSSNYPGQVWEMSYWRKRESQQMDRILLRTVQLWELRRQHCTGLQPAPRRRSATNTPWGSWDCSSITEKGEVCRSW